MHAHTHRKAAEAASLVGYWVLPGWELDFGDGSICQKMTWKMNNQERSANVKTKSPVFILIKRVI